ncbi:hypothetical protein T484DRAFT_1842882, partial [Baffinella frigidus]
VRFTKDPQVLREPFDLCIVHQMPGGSMPAGAPAARFFLIPTPTTSGLAGLRSEVIPSLATAVAGGPAAQYMPVNHRNASGVSSMREGMPPVLRVKGVAMRLISMPTPTMMINGLRDSVGGIVDLLITFSHAILAPRRTDADNMGAPGLMCLALIFKGEEVARTEPTYGRAEVAARKEAGTVRFTWDEQATLSVNLADDTDIFTFKVR